MDFDVSLFPITPDWITNRACGLTVNKPDLEIDLSKLARSEHSPLRTQVFWIELINIPTFVSVHLVRHKVGVEHFVKSNREDRPGYTGDTGRNHPVNHGMFINAQSLINMARKRLCNKAHPETIKVMEAICHRSPDWLKPFLVPECEYRGGHCYEFKSCGRYPVG